MLVFVENIGQKYDFHGGGVVSGRVWGWRWGPDPKKKLLIVTMFRLSLGNFN